jgi:transposase InsO family protein
MQKYGLKALIWRGFKVKTTDSNHSYGYARNLLPGMQVTGPNQVWVADITYIRVLTGFVYLAAILDLFSRRVVGWALSQKIDHELCLAALKHAVEIRRPTAGLIHHSDRGVQYACNAYQDFLRDHEIVPSMSAKGYCYDNAFMESWFKTLKAEEVYLTEYENYDDAKARLPEFIEAVYNNKRIHSGISYLAPAEFEELWEKGMLRKLGIQAVLNLPADPSK